MSKTLIVCVAVFGLALSRTGYGQDAQVQKGQKLFVDQKCGMCHSVAGKGNAKGSLDKVGGEFKPEEIREWIVNAKEMAAKHDAQRKPPMKDFSSLSKGDVDALVAYLSTLK
jgi:mono/diheme cytochrome c family protein